MNGPPGTRVELGLSQVLTTDEVVNPWGPFSPAIFPAGFDAIAQLDRRLLQFHLREGLARRGHSTVDSSVSLNTAQLTPDVREAVSQHLPFGGQVSFGFEGASIELRLDGASLTALGTVDSDDGAVGGDAELSWRLTLNLLIHVRKQNDATVLFSSRPTTGFDTQPVVSTVATGRVLSGIDPVLAPDQGSSTTTTRHTLLSGRVVARANLGGRLSSELLQFGAHAAIGDGGLKIDPDTDAALLTFLEEPVGSDLWQRVRARALSLGDLAVTPIFALAGEIEPARVRAMELGVVVLELAVLPAGNGREVLSLCIGLEESSGVKDMVRSFLGDRNFAYYVSDSIALPAIRERWKARRADRVFVSDVPVELESDDGGTEEGLARIRLSLAGDPEGVEHAIGQGSVPDSFQIITEAEVRLENLWLASGEEVADLGVLGEPVREPFVMAITFGGPQGAAEPANNDLTELLFDVIKPCLVPQLDPIKARRLAIVSSSALKALFVSFDVDIDPRTTTRPTVGAEVLAPV